MRQIETRESLSRRTERAEPLGAELGSSQLRNPNRIAGL